ncbi:YajQ family cyclic di-GMP-binding protein [Terasakiispira papahanaumokuakeensis]|uniref:Nucleotide-binding protein BFW38_09620 n=1 Tax=Terasakiispira papahanaumokuakeensis TaxID=197479 RepID=A0A1E2V9R2_9GAMM|nr:YajQ family cyclic di-GMP-binding protein [Terasakiispira papahanaumokuakeensis]ODC03759.1 YajQ family cyclic di-GMP-binding protein [Terasakiispira papahanaumokuakeensis]
MPSFDIVSELDQHQVTNAVDQANRVVGNRFDFKGVDAQYERNDHVVTLTAEAEFQVRQMLDILRNELTRKDIDVGCLEEGDIDEANRSARMKVTLREGIDSDLAKKIVRIVKDAKLKVQTQIQGEQVRVTGKKRDDLQQVISLLRQSDLDLPLQFNNFRD